MQIISTMNVQTAVSAEDIKKCWKVIHELRPHLIEDDFVSLVTDMMKEGYMLSFIEENGIALAAVGYRYLQFLFNGKHIYIDDLVSLPEARGKGYAGALLDHVTALAKEKGYTSVTLDSGHHRYDAHRLYLNKGYNIIAHHFVQSFKGK
jgi:GNAT superfamily N-acetyltransferase